MTDKETKLDQFFVNDNIPEPDENARKTAVNLAMSEFETLQKEKNEKKFQGFEIFSRLIGKSTSQDRRNTMNKKFIYGGMATAMVVVLATSASIYQTQRHDLVTGKPLELQVESTVANIPVAEETLPESYKETLEVYDEASVDTAIKEQESFIPTPVSPPQADMAARAERKFAKKEGSITNEQPLERWRVLQENRAVVGAMAPEADMSMVAPGMPAPTMILPEPMPPRKADNDKFEDHEISPVKQVSQEPVSTFSIDVDTASYSFVRRQLNNGVLPNPDAVRIEEMVNYFPYDYQGPERSETPFNANVSVTASPWKEGNKLIHIGIKGYDIDVDVQPKANLVFLIDVSGSMSQQDKLPLLINSFKMLLNTLQPEDTVAIVTYAGRAGTALEPTQVKNKQQILNVLNSLRSGGSTAGAAGIQGAYALAEQNFDKEAVNRVILATDGDFNVGMSSNDDLKELIEKKRESGIFLSVLGFGQGNLNDHLMQTLAQNGNGIAAHIDTLQEAQKVLVEEATSSLFPIAKDVKIQVEFNPEIVSEYRLVGYETRKLNREDFNNDKVDAGDIGAGHTVTAIYEITPKGSGNELYGQSRYAKPEETSAQTDFGNEYAFLKMRYKLPNEDTSTLITTPITSEELKTLVEVPTPDCVPGRACPEILPAIGDDALFSIAVAGFGQLLKNDKYIGNFDYDNVLALAEDGKGEDKFGYRAEFINLVRLAKSLDQN